MTLTKEQIGNINDAMVEIVDVPEWKGKVGIRVMSGLERETFEAGNKEAEQDKVSSDRFMVRLLVRCLCDDKGNRLFADGEVESLMAKNGKALFRLFEKALEVNKLREEDKNDAVKNS